MKYFFSHVLLIASLISIGAYTAEGKSSKVVYDHKIAPVSMIEGQILPDDTLPAATDKKGKKGKKDKKEKSAKGAKDSQNQTQFMKPDIDATDYNFYDRKKISTPLMPRYDLDSAVYQQGNRKKEEQQKAYTQNKYHFPARPKDQIEIGLQGGSSLIAGDVRADWTKGWGGGFTIRKALNYFFSLRFSYTYSQSKALDLQPRNDAVNDAALNGQTNNANYTIPGGGDVTIFHNYRTRTHAAAIEGVLNLGNILFHKERTLVNFNLFFGIGMHAYRTQEDMLDNNGKIYDFTGVENDRNALIAQHASQSAINKKVGSDLAQLLSGNYTVDAVDPLKGGMRLAKYNFVPDLSTGAGLDFHVSKWVTLGIEEHFIYNHNSNLDGVNYLADQTIPGVGTTGGGLTPHYDHYFTTMVHVNFNIGKNRVEPLWWLNPMAFTYQKLSDVNPDKLAKELFKDTDEDGVPDKLDKEPNTEKGCPVDAHGVTLDSDKDGIPDCHDKEPFSPPGYPIDQNGVAIIPPNPCCDTSADGSGGPGGLNGTGAGRRRGGGAGGGGNSGYDCSKMQMPGVYFDEDKYYIDPAYESALNQVAEKLQLCPDVKMVVTGIDESKNDIKYNEQLGYNRASSVVDYLVEKYGISRDRFVVKYSGKKPTPGMTPQEKKKSRRVDFNYAGDGEKGESNPPAPHPGLKAGSNK